MTSAAYFKQNTANGGSVKVPGAGTVKPLDKYYFIALTVHGSTDRSHDESVSGLNRRFISFCFQLTPFNVLFLITNVKY